MALQAHATSSTLRIKSLVRATTEDDVARMTVTRALYRT
jgi:hypothetical protein